MANSKISALTAASTPLAGTETLPIVQSGVTKQVSVANLTAGRAVSAGAITTTGKFYEYLASDGSNIPTWFSWSASGVLAIVSGGDSAYADVYTKLQGGLYNQASTNNVDLIVQSKDPGKDAGWRVTAGSGANAGADNGYFAISKIKTDTTAIIATEAGRFTSDLNWVPAAAKGINFTANTPAAGMTSQLLNWYEEGTWTPNQGVGLTLVGAFSSAGTYTRIGRQVFIRGSVSGATSVAVASAGAITTNLPYSAAADATGTAINAANNASSILRVSSATLTAATAIAATTTITFSAVYSV